MNLGKKNCKWCGGTGVMCRTKDDGRIWVCSCIPVMSDEWCRSNRLYCDAGIEKLKNSGWNEDFYLDNHKDIY